MCDLNHRSSIEINDNLCPSSAEYLTRFVQYTVKDAEQTDI
jgi:hypothetical protein